MSNEELIEFKELQLLEHLDGTAHASNWTAWDARRAEKEEARGVDRWSLTVTPKQPTVNERRQ
jgi:hypothetical protein